MVEKKYKHYKVYEDIGGKLVYKHDVSTIEMAGQIYVSHSGLPDCVTISFESSLKDGTALLFVPFSKGNTFSSFCNYGHEIGFLILDFDLHAGTAKILTKPGYQSYMVSLLDILALKGDDRNDLYKVMCTEVKESILNQRTFLPILNLSNALYNNLHTSCRSESWFKEYEELEQFEESVSLFGETTDRIIELLEESDARDKCITNHKDEVLYVSPIALRSDRITLRGLKRFITVNKNLATRVMPVIDSFVSDEILKWVVNRTCSTLVYSFFQIDDSIENTRKLIQRIVTKRPSKLYKIMLSDRNSGLILDAPFVRRLQFMYSILLFIPNSSNSVDMNKAFEVFAYSDGGKSELRRGSLNIKLGNMMPDGTDARSSLLRLRELDNESEITSIEKELNRIALSFREGHHYRE